MPLRTKALISLCLVAICTISLLFQHTGFEQATTDDRLLSTTLIILSLGAFGIFMGITIVTILFGYFVRPLATLSILAGIVATVLIVIDAFRHGWHPVPLNGAQIIVLGFFWVWWHVTMIQALRVSRPV